MNISSSEFYRWKLIFGRSSKERHISKISENDKRPNKSSPSPFWYFRTADRSLLREIINRSHKRATNEEKGSKPALPHKVACRGGPLKTAQPHARVVEDNASGKRPVLYVLSTKKPVKLWSSTAWVLALDLKTFFFKQKPKNSQKTNIPIQKNSQTTFEKEAESKLDNQGR